MERSRRCGCPQNLLDAAQEEIHLMDEWKMMDLILSWKRGDS